MAARGSFGLPTQSRNGCGSLEEALTGWRELESEAGEQLLELDGLIKIVTDLGQSSAAALEACGVVWQRLDRDEVELAISAASSSRVVWRAAAGGRHRPGRSCAGGLCTRHRCPLRGAGGVAGRSGCCLRGRHSRRVVNDLIEPPLPVRLTRETVCYFRPADSRPVPAFVSFGPRTGGICFYALADPVHGIKAAVHHGGPTVINPREPGEPDTALVDAITGWVAEHALLADPRPVETQTCLYTTTVDETFILERRGRVVVGSACSGHGFKFAPAIGARLAALAIEAAGS